MSTFTVITDQVVTLGVTGHDIHDVVRRVRDTLMDGEPKNNRVIINYSLLERGGEQSGTFHHAFLTMVTVRGRELKIAHVWGEQPMEARRQYHATDHRTHITCKECGNDEFYNVDRSLDYENHICAECGATAHTLTETGASA